MVPLLIVIPALGAGPEQLALDLGYALLKAAAPAQRGAQVCRTRLVLVRQPVSADD